jgi:hypothetical protein
MVPILIGIGFNSVDKKLKEASYGLNILMCSFLGNLPAPSFMVLLMKCLN